MKRFFRSKLCQWLFARIHPNLGVGIANYWSLNSRKANTQKENNKPGEQEWLVKFCRDTLQTQFYDYMVFGHRHLPLDIRLSDQTRYINLGEWITYDYSYAVFDGQELSLHFAKMP